MNDTFLNQLNIKALSLKGQQKSVGRGFFYKYFIPKGMEQQKNK